MHKKFNGLGVLFKIGICVTTGWIVWINELFRCGDWPDLKLAQQEELYDPLANCERCIAHGTYCCRYALIQDAAAAHYEKEHVALARARYETVNGQ